MEKEAAKSGAIATAAATAEGADAVSESVAEVVMELVGFLLLISHVPRLLLLLPPNCLSSLPDWQLASSDGIYTQLDVE